MLTVSRRPTMRWIKRCRDGEERMIVISSSSVNLTQEFEKGKGSGYMVTHRFFPAVLVFGQARMI